MVDYLAQLIAKLFNLQLQRGLLALIVREFLVDGAELGRGASSHNNANSLAASDIGAGEDKVCLILVQRIHVVNGIGILEHADTLARQDGLVDAPGPWEMVAHGKRCKLLRALQACHGCALTARAAA